MLYFRRFVANKPENHLSVLSPVFFETELFIDVFCVIDAALRLPIRPFQFHIDQRCIHPLGFIAIGPWSKPNARLFKGLR